MRKIFKLSDHIEHPGWIVKRMLPSIGIEDKPATRLAMLVHMDRSYITQFLRGKQDVTQQLAQKLGLFFNTDASFWHLLQTVYDNAQNGGWYHANIDLPNEEKAHSDRVSISGGRELGDEGPERDLHKTRV